MFLNYLSWRYVKKTIHVNTSLPMDLCLTTSFMYIVQNEPILRCSPGLPNPMGRSIRTKSARQLRGFLWAVDGMWRLVLRPTSGRRRTLCLHRDAASSWAAGPRSRLHCHNGSGRGRTWTGTASPLTGQCCGHSSLNRAVTTVEIGDG